MLILQIRTDLAMEARELAGNDSSGIEVDRKDYGEITMSSLIIKTDEAAKNIGKDMGSYITAEMKTLTDDFKDADKRLEIIAKEIRKLLPDKGLVLVAGLGNENITPDALGPKSARRILATRHIQGDIARSTGLDRLRAVAVLATGVTGQTGIETGELILSVCERIKPAAVVVIDALASRRLERLGCTVQITDTGISPGDGVGNHRAKINRDTVGVPVISIGIPTVVDAFTLAADLLLDSDDNSVELIKRSVYPNGRKMVVTPGEIDLLVERGAKLISMAVNTALQPSLKPSDLLSLVR